MVFLNNLNKQHIYIISVLPFTTSRHKNYTWLIKQITTYLNKVNRSNIKELATHTAWLFYYNNNWFICEVSFNGRVHKLFAFDKQTKYYISEIEVNPQYINAIKLDLLEKYAKRDVNTFLTKIVASVWNYPIFKAIGSVEFPNHKTHYYLLNKLTDFISDVAKSTRRLFNVQSEFCTEAVVQDLFELYATKHIDNVSSDLIKKIIDVRFRFDEFCPQNILETTNYIELIDN